MSRARARSVCVAIGVCAAIGLATTSMARAAGDPSPFEAIRHLQILQDQIAEGDAIAQAAYAKAIDRTARIFTRAKPATWNDPRNARALVVYLFSGGRAPLIADSIAPESVAADYRKLYAGALAYALGSDEPARDALLSIDPKTLPSGLGGHLALVQAGLCPPEDKVKALALLDLARLLEPGTLIEEAALRKEISLIGAAGDLDKFTSLARRYLQAYSRSVYADNFRQLVAAAAMQTGSSDSDAAGLRLTRLAASLDKADRLRLYLAIARAAVVAGHFKMAAVAADEARRLADKAGPDEARALVYLGAAGIVGERYDMGRKALDGVAAERLGLKDRALRASAIAVADLIRRPPTASAGVAAAVAPGDVASDGERALAVADKMLDEASR